MLKIKLIAKRITTKEMKSFIVFKTEVNGRLEDVKFTKEVNNMPVKSCYIYVNEDKINEDRNRLYPCFWVKSIEKIEELETQNVSNYFEQVK